tara:strand:- start:442 stop:783 length:342 start_codon:yes stop_codon:yes gene_type:complete
MSAELNELKRHEDDWDAKILSNLILMNRVYRPDEYTMDDFASMALELEDRADTISSRIQEVNDALLVAEARNKELEVKLSEANNILGLVRDTLNESQGGSKKIITEWLEGTGK